MKVSGGKGGLTGSFGPAPAFSQARELYSNFTKRTIKRARTVHGPVPSQDQVGKEGLGERNGGYCDLRSLPGSPFASVPLLLSETVCSETVTIKTRKSLVCWFILCLTNL